MPYSSVTDLPEAIRDHLPVHAQEIYMKSFNNAHVEYGDDNVAARVAWSAVKKQYEKNEKGIWVKK